METRNKTLNSPPVIEKSPFGSGGFYQTWLYQGYYWLTTPKQGEDPFRIILNNIQKREFWSFHGKLYLILCADPSLSPHQQTSALDGLQRAPLLVASGQDQLLWRGCSPPLLPHYSHGDSPLGHQEAENGCWLTISTKIVAHPFPAAFCPHPFSGRSRCHLWVLQFGSQTRFISDVGGDWEKRRRCGGTGSFGDLCSWLVDDVSLCPRMVIPLWRYPELFLWGHESLWIRAHLQIPVWLWWPL